MITIILYNATRVQEQSQDLIHSDVALDTVRSAQLYLFTFEYSSLHSHHHLLLSNT